MGRTPKLAQALPDEAPLRNSQASVVAYPGLPSEVPANGDRLTALLAGTDPSHALHAHTTKRQNPQKPHQNPKSIGEKFWRLDLSGSAGPSRTGSPHVAAQVGTHHLMHRLFPSKSVCRRQP